MIAISNRHYAVITDKLPRILELVRKGNSGLSLRQNEDIRQLSLLVSHLTRKKHKSNK